MKTSSLHRQSGLNLIEILVAALILSVGLLSMAGLQIASLRSTQNATQKQQAAFMVHELLERMRGNRTAALAGEYNATVLCTGSTPPQNCSNVTACSPSQLATYDLYTVQCGDSSVNTIRSGITDQLLDGQLTVSCPSGNCTDGITVSVRWRELLASDEVRDSSSGAELETQEFDLSIDAVI